MIQTILSSKTIRSTYTITKQLLTSQIFFSLMEKKIFLYCFFDFSFFLTTIPEIFTHNFFTCQRLSNDSSKIYQCSLEFEKIERQSLLFLCCEQMKITWENSEKIFSPLKKKHESAKSAILWQMPENNHVLSAQTLYVIIHKYVL